MVKSIGTAARRAIERELGTRVHLALRVRVRKHWRADEQMLDRLGHRVVNIVSCEIRARGVAARYVQGRREFGEAAGRGFWRCSAAAGRARAAERVRDRAVEHAGQVQAGRQSRVHERGVLAAALVDGLFQTVQQQVPQDAQDLRGPDGLERSDGRTQASGTPTWRCSTLRATCSPPRGGFTPQARADLPRSAALALIRAGHPYGLGDLLPYGKAGVINFAVAFPTRFGTRILLTGFAPAGARQLPHRGPAQDPGRQGSAQLPDRRQRRGARLDQPGAAGRVRVPHAGAARPRSRTRLGRRQRPLLRLGPADATRPERIVLSAPNGPAVRERVGTAQVGAVGDLRRVRAGRDRWRSSSGAGCCARLRRSGRPTTQLESVNDELESVNATLERRAAELARSNAELEQFASIASHDLQEPLRKVRTFTQQLTVTDADHLSEKGRDYLERANAAAERMQRLIEDLLKFSRVATHGRPFAAGRSGRGRTTECSRTSSSRSSGRARSCASASCRRSTATQLQLRQLMQNLISNALKFRREDVVPEVDDRARAPTTAPSRSRSATTGSGSSRSTPGGSSACSSGCTAAAATRAPGIGLALCRKIAERHGGTIVADGEPGRRLRRSPSRSRCIHGRDAFAGAPTATNGDATPDAVRRPMSVA